MARDVNNGSLMTITTNRLESIATRQRKSRARDFVFAAFVALAAAISVTSIQTAVSAAQSHVAQR